MVIQLAAHGPSPSRAHLMASLASMSSYLMLHWSPSHSYIVAPPPLQGGSLVATCLPSLATHMALVSIFLAGLLAPQVLLSHIYRAAQVMFNEGLQHNMHRTYHGEQRTFQTFCGQYHLTAFPASEDMLMVFVTYLDNHLQRCYATKHHYIAAIHMVHIALGLLSPLENCPHLHQTASGNLPTTTPTPAGLGLTRLDHRIPLLGQASTLVPQPQG